jgi:hypothetical protein
MNTREDEAQKQLISVECKDKDTAEESLLQRGKEGGK